MTSFTGKTVYISGAGSGIGFETALAFASEGARIVATDLRQPGLDDLKAKIEANGGTCRTAILDVTDEAGTEAFVEALQADGFLPDIAVNNAGIVYIIPFVETEAEIWRRTLDINVVGVAIGSRAFARAWIAAGVKGHIVNVASMASIAPLPTISAYSASKYAVEGFCETLVIEMEPHGISVTCVHPGIINTPLIRNPDMVRLPDEQFEAIKAHYIAEGAEPSVVARDIVKGVKAKATNVYAGPSTGSVALMKRFLPRAWLRKLIKDAAIRIGYLR